MDVIDDVRKCVATWTKGGEAECRNILVQPHCDPTCLEILTTAYHTLITSVLSTWSPPFMLSQTQLLDFIQSLLASLPSSSSTKASSYVATFGDHLVDMIWSIDAALDEVLSDAKTALSASASSASDTNSKTNDMKQQAEDDKEILQSIVKGLLNMRIISPESCRERLDIAILANVGLIADKSMMEKKEIRMRTGLFYKQNKFNLLREQSEGYSKLVVELTSGMGPPHSAATGLPTESYSEIRAQARPVWEEVTSIIGYFDLDPNRALDVILDVLSVNLTTHYTFFLALLSHSHWRGAYQSPPNRVDGVSMEVDASLGAYKGKSLDEVLVIAEEHTFNGGDIPASSNTRVLSQVLGFKFAYYQIPELAGTTPKNLYLMTALLIREKFISLEDIYSHLAPSEEDMELTYKEYLEHVQARIAGAKFSQLAMAAPLESGSSPQHKPKPVTETKKIEVKHKNQKIGLLHALLSLGVLRPAFAILTKYPWIVDACPEIADLLLRVLKYSLQPLYESLLVTKSRNPSFTKPRTKSGPSGTMQSNAQKSMLTLWAPTPPSTTATEFVFFYPNWADRVPVVAELDDLMDVVEPILHFVGLHVSRDPLFLTKFLRLGRPHISATTPPIDPETKKPNGKADPTHPIRMFWFTVLRRYLIPALPLIRGNAVCTVEIWNIIRHFPMEERWQLYGEWKTSIYQNHPELKIRQVQADRESKGLLRRLAHNTIDGLAGPVAKLAHSNPCIFFSNAVNQIMAYDNLASVVIQALRFVTNMGFDVLVYIVLDALANPNKDRVKDDGVNTADWLQSLASFTGMLFRRYSAELSPVLKYIAHQLHNGQTTEIVVLRELIWKMAGIEPLPSLSEAQIAAMAGGPVLRIEAIASTTRGARFDPTEAMRGPQRLGRSLLDSPSLALPLLVQVAQQRQACVYKAQDAHLKSLAGLFDATHGVMLQYLELLTSPIVISPEVYATMVLPSLAELGQKYGVCAPICMQIFRPVWQTTLLKHALLVADQERVAAEEAEKRLKAALTAKREPSATSRVASPALGTLNTPDSNVETKNTTGPVLMEGVTTEESEAKGEVSSPDSPWLPQLAQFFDDVKQILPASAIDVIGPGFYLTFWQLSMYDLAPPVARYAEESSNLRVLSKQEDAKYIAADRSSDRTKRSLAATHRQRRDRYNTFANLLSDELKDQSASRSFTIKRLAREKAHWFAHVFPGPKTALIASAIIEHCIQPRCLLSPMDADFCAQFIKVLHVMGTPGFHTLAMYDKILGDHVKVVLFSCSEYEARNYGRFLRGILTDLHHWFRNKQSFEQDNQSTSNGQVVQHRGFQRSLSNKGQQEVLVHDRWLTVVRKWHRKLGKSFTECIQTEEYMHVYNAIIVLKEILPVFPLAIISDAGPSIDSAIDQLLENETRGDLKILGKAYSAGLKKRHNFWAPPKTAAKANGTVLQRPGTHTPQPIPERPRNLPTGPQAFSGSNNAVTRAVSAPGPSTPSGPRSATQAQAHPPTQPQPLMNGQLEKPSDANQPPTQPTSKIPIENIPRPEVVRRIRTEGIRDSPRPSPVPSAPLRSDAPPYEPRNVPTPPPRNQETLSLPSGPASGGRRSPAVHPDMSRSNLQPRENIPSNLGHQELHRPNRPGDDRSRTESIMPPPSVPSQKASAQELRDSARLTVPRLERVDSQAHNGTSVPSPRHRSPSPVSRPGTRNPSNDSRGSGGRNRQDDGRRGERDENREMGGSTLTRRDSLTHTRSERSGRDRRDRDDRDDRDRDRDRGRDRHGHNDRDREKDKERDRERDRERERDRDRHRRDEKDRDRDRKESRTQASGTNTPVNDDRNLPARPEASRRRGDGSSEEALGKRRRPAEDDPERGSKRSSRKDSHREDRSRRPAEKDDRARDSDRKRKERDAHEGDNRPPLPDKPAAEKKIPEGPAKAPPAGAPSAPRAMAIDRTKGDINAGRDRHRDGREQPKGPPPNAPTAPDPLRAANSLRARLSEKDLSLSHPPPQAPSGYRPDGPSNRRDDDRDGNARKRTASDRDKDAHESLTGPGDINQQVKRPRINRNRYNQGPNNNSHGLARKLLPIDPSAGDKSRGRQD